MEFQRDAQTRLTMVRLRDKFGDEDEGTVQNVHKNNSGRPRISTSPTREREVIESNLLENLFGKRLVRQDFQNRVSIAF
ncbi:hypothetical protein ANN_22453 [Periplaneta americana]|uniref:Uncharacterized protein n=1 Tax=Periplaneta americana TaxID=6978 RepID=A0ABQ8S893_PERAM|nr:hypothetical protein ANN_22453 [Periplaneta americana]